MSKYRLVASCKNGQRITLAEYDLYDEALAAYGAVNARKADGIDEFPAVSWYGVRSSDDPKWSPAAADKPGAPGTGGPVVWDWRDAYYAVRDWRRKEIGATALAMLKKAEPGVWLHQIERDVRESLAARGIAFERIDVLDAVKARVILGRCRPNRYSGTRHREDAQGYWLAKKDGPLHKRNCPLCGARLSQSTLVFGAGFRRLDLTTGSPS